MKLLLRPWHLAGAIILVLVIIFIQLVLNWSQVIRQTQRFGSEQLTIQYSHLLDSSIVTFQEAVQQPFTPGTAHAPVSGFDNYNHWYNVSIENTSDQAFSLRLVVDSPTVDQFTLYYYDPRFNSTQSQSFGVHVPDVELTQRILANVPFDIVPGQTRQFWFHVETNGSPHFPIMVMTEDGFEFFDSAVHLIWGTFFGLTILVAIYNAVLFVGLKDNIYLYYVAYLVAVLFLVSTIHGFGFYIFSEPFQLFLSRQLVLVQVLTGAAALAFGAAFLQIHKTAPALFQKIRWLLVCLLVLAVVTLALKESTAAPLFSFAQTIIYIGIFAMVRVQFRARYQWTRYYLISWIPFLIGAAVGMLLFIGVVPYGFLTRHALLLSVLIEITFLSMALADRMGESERQRLFQATHDVKTGLANDFYLNQALKKLPHNNETIFVVLGVQVQNFTTIQPFLSSKHRTLLLQALVAKFTDSLSELCHVVPLGLENSVPAVVINDSTIAFLIRVKNENELEELMANIAKPINYNPVPDDIPFRILCRFAARPLQADKNDPETVQNNLVHCLNVATDRDQPYLIYKDNLDDNSERQIRLARDLEVAIEQNELDLYHQPQLHFQNHSACYSEVLVRWTHAEFGFVSPVEFVSIAEQIGLIHRLTFWVVERAFEHYLQLTEIPKCKPHISINVSANDLSRLGFYSEVTRLVEKYSVPPGAFTLELTETSHQQTNTIFGENMRQLKAMGFHFAIDDFGTGYASLTYLSELPFDEIKIDRSFVSQAVASNRQRQIIQSTVKLAEDLRLSVTAEGVEDAETMAEMKELNCDKIQGYVHAKPMAFETYVEWLNIK